MPFPELPADVFGALDRALHRLAKQQATQGGGPRVIMSTGFGLFG